MNSPAPPKKSKAANKKQVEELRRNHIARRLSSALVRVIAMVVPTGGVGGWWFLSLHGRPVRSKNCSKKSDEKKADSSHQVEVEQDEAR